MLYTTQHSIIISKRKLYYCNMSPMGILLVINYWKYKINKPNCQRFKVW
jgi:hypothetical protein